jgi:tRNA-dihydrouridine synthase A
VTREDVVRGMSDYLARAVEQGVPARAVVRHMLGLYHGRPGARRWRQMLSDPAFLARYGGQSLAAAEAAFARFPSEGKPELLLQQAGG